VPRLTEIGKNGGNRECMESGGGECVLNESRLWVWTPWRRMRNRHPSYLRLGTRGCVDETVRRAPGYQGHVLKGLTWQGWRLKKGNRISYKKSEVVWGIVEHCCSCRGTEKKVSVSGKNSTPRILMALVYVGKTKWKGLKTLASRHQEEKIFPAE
jgi:hypothetical protein